jgi:transglutaminase-like putative cysteine protease
VTEREVTAAPTDRPAATFVLDQRIRYRYSTPVTDLRQRLKIVPPSAHGPQRRRRWRLTVDGVRTSTTETFLDAFGNLTVDVTVPQVEDSIEFVLDVEADTHRLGWSHDIAADPRYLRPTRLTAPDDAIVELASGAGGADVAALCARVHQSMTYAWGVTGIRTTAADALAGGRGVCQDYAHIMLSACRVAGLPARYVSGHLTGEGGSHAWVEVFHPHPSRRATWIAEGWDPTHDRRTDAAYLVVAVGRDYADAAPMSGSYKGTTATNTLAVRKRLDLA